jgi:serine/threonine-protein kinase
MTLARQLSGKVFGEYKLGEYLGYSGIAHVYKAVHSQDHQHIAVQLLPNHFIDQPGFTETYLNKANPLIELRHKNIIPVVDCGVDNGFPYLVIEHFDGPTLQDLIDASENRKTKIPVEACLFIIQSLGAALSHAHKMSIPHGNLQPTNILLEKSGMVMVGDFRLYRIMIYKPQRQDVENDQPDGDLTSLLEDKRLDLSALGHIFYQIVTGRVPFETSSTLLFSREKPRPEIIPPSEFLPDISEEMERVIVKSLAQDKDERYQTIDQFISDLSKLKRDVETAMLPSAQLLELARTSGRFRESEMPEKIEPQKLDKTVLYFPDNGHTLALDEGQEYTIGRKYRGQPILPDIDLTPFKGYDWGISRMHASLKVSAGEATITDLDSSNGTWVAGKRIPPHEPTDLINKDIFLLGRLRLQILLPE